MKISKVIYQDHYRLLVFFDNQQTVLLSMQEKLQTLRFSNLRQIAVFEAVETDGKGVQWPGGISMSISEILELAAGANKGRL